ncbi:terpenoid synthase [Rhodocollybia butyracea]|uniref:Terpenoid synthase n=1 Tax=Rhodocollybia butyracea TaxID=206335 RepID=A0A9P5U0S5_9AGAR|nr:terpenoid synthase [Rhodocollybia butyracea]
MKEGAKFFETAPSTPGKSVSKDYLSRLQLLFREIDYRYVAPQPPSMDFLRSHHSWMHDTFGPTTSWTTSQLDTLGDATFSIAERFYPFADIEMKAIMAKLSAIVIHIDDSLEDDTMYNEIGSFVHHVFTGKAQPSALLDLYHECIKEMSHLHEGDPVLQAAAVIPWINYIDGCLLEKRLLTIDTELRASPYDMGYQNLAKQRCHFTGHAARETLPGARVRFPLYIRHRTGIAEAYAAAIFKSTKYQDLPLSRYIMALPDITFYTLVLNDLISFHKEELGGETVNMIHLQTQSFKGYAGSGASGEWTVSDTFNLLCNQVKDATDRIDEILRLQDCERIAREKLDSRDIGLSDIDVTIALQWREYRDGYISWHLESQRYKLDFLRLEQFGPKFHSVSRS